MAFEEKASKLHHDLRYTLVIVADNFDESQRLT